MERITGTTLVSGRTCTAWRYSINLRPTAKPEARRAVTSRSHVSDSGQGARGNEGD